MNIDKMIERWQEEFAFCEQQEMFNTQNKEYITAHNHAVRKEQIRLFIKDLRQVKKMNIPAVVGRSEQLCDHPRSERSYIGLNMLRCNKCGKEFS